MSNPTNDQASDGANNFFFNRAQLEQDIAQLLGEFSRKYPAIPGLSLSLFRRIGNRTAAGEFAVQVHPCP